MAILTSLFLLLGNSDGRATKAGQGNTGAPGDEMIGANPRTCISCHGSSSIQSNLNINIIDQNSGDTITEYIPGNTYLAQATISVSSGNPKAYGFQMVSLRDSDDQGMETWSEPADNTKIQFASNTGRTYIEHDGPSTSNEFSSLWTAPEAGTGNITFYACGNAVDLSGDTSGDGGALASLTLAENNPSADHEFPSPTVTLFPNPSSSMITIKHISAFTSLTIYNTHGQIIHQSDVTAELKSVDIDQLDTGLYIAFLENADEKNNKQIPFVKQ